MTVPYAEITAQEMRSRRISFWCTPLSLTSFSTSLTEETDDAKPLADPELLLGEGSFGV